MARLGYNQENDRYGILSMDPGKMRVCTVEKLLKLKINDEWKADRIEYSHKNKRMVFSK